MRFRHIVSTLKHMLMFVADHVVWLFPQTSNQSSREILLVKADKIGDFVVWLDAARDYRLCFPNNRLILIADKSWACFARQIGWWDEVWPLDFPRFGDDTMYRMKFLLRVRRHGFYCAITTSRSLRYADTIIRFSGAKERIGPDGNEAVVPLRNDISFSNRWFTKVVPVTPRRRTTALDLNLEFLYGMGGLALKHRKPRLPTFPDHLLSLGSKQIPSEPYIVFVLGAGWPGRQWPTSRFASIAQKIYDTYTLRILLCGTSSERKLGSLFLSQLSVETRRIISNMIGQTDLTALISILKQFGCSHFKRDRHTAYFRRIRGCVPLHWWRGGFWTSHTILRIA